MLTDIRTPTNGARPDLRPLPALLKTRDKDRLGQYTTALAYYRGKQWPAARAASEPLRRLTVNYLRAITNKTASYVMQGRTTSVQPRSESDADTTAAADAERALNEIAANNALDRLDHTTEIDCAVLGDAAFKITWDTADQRVAITAPDMAGLFPWTHPANPLRLLRLAHRYQIPQAEATQLWGLRSADDPAWLIEDWTDDALRIHIDDHFLPDLSFANPYGLIPYVVYPNEQVPKRWWGESDVIPLYEVAQELNREFSRISNILELSGNPIAILQGVEEAQNIQSYPGAVWTLPADGRAYILDLLQHGAIAQHHEYLQSLQRALHDISETPRTAFGDNQRDLSGVALEVELQPLLHKVARKRLIRSDAYNHRAAIALALTDQYTGTDHLNAGTIITTWEAPTPQDRTREVNDETTLVAAQLKSHRTSMATLGQVDPDAEWARIQEEQAQVESQHGTV